VQFDLKQIGLNCDITPLDRVVQTDKGGTRGAKFDILLNGWGADYPDPQNWMASLFGCNASNNKYNYCNKQFDTTAQKGDTSTDQNARLQAYAQAQQILIQDLPVAPLLFRGRMVLVKPWIGGMVITPKDDYPGFSFLSQLFVTQH
jgi:ABC-type oligopeptide transport system substrate-binding subunit